MTPDSVLPAFRVLAEETGVPLPAMLAALMDARLTNGDDVAFGSCFDLEWIGADESRSAIAEWLNPRFQSGRRFLPFAQTGAGDLYCVTCRPDDSSGGGIALVWHDANESVVRHQDFSSFATALYLQAAADMEHLTGEMDDAEAMQCVRDDVGRVAAHLDAPHRDMLLPLLAGDAGPQQVRDGPKARPREVLAFISAQQLDLASQSLASVAERPFTVVPRWECGQA